MSEELCRVFITEQKRTCCVVEVHKLPADLDANVDQIASGNCQTKGRLREDFYRLDLDQMEDDLKASILASQMVDGSVAFIATDKGLVRWQFLLLNEDEPYETLQIEKSKQLECLMTQTEAVFYRWEAQQFVLINLKSFQQTYCMKMPGTKLDKMCIIEYPFNDATFGFKIIGLDWAKDR